MVVLYPCVKRILGAAMSKDKISKIVGNIDGRSISLFRLFRRDATGQDYVSAIAENPLFVLSEVRDQNDKRGRPFNTSVRLRREY